MYKTIAGKGWSTF